MWYSSDYGLSYAANIANPSVNWVSVAISKNANVVIGAAQSGGTDSQNGLAWFAGQGGTATFVSSTEGQVWTAVAINSDGSRAYASQLGAIFVSTDGGKTWKETNSGPNYWYSVACDYKGYNLLAHTATASQSGYIYSSNNREDTSWVKENAPYETYWGLASRCIWNQ